jgi:hypothetical protein
MDIGWDSVDLIYLAKYRDMWRSCVSTAMNCRGRQKAGNFCVGERMMSSQYALCTVDIVAAVTQYSKLHCLDSH